MSIVTCSFLQTCADVAAYDGPGGRTSMLAGSTLYRGTIPRRPAATDHAFRRLVLTTGLA
jgi:hypothetical protein